MNKYFCIGIIGIDPEPINNDGCKLRVAVNSYKKDEPLWLSVFVFGNLAKSCLEFKKKGNKLLVEGRLDVSDVGKPVIFADNLTFL